MYLNQYNIMLQNIVKLIEGLNPGPKTLNGSNTFLIGNGPKRVLIDTGQGIPGYLDLLRQHTQEEKCQISEVLITHHHFDHIGGIGQVLELFPEAKVYKCLEHFLDVDLKTEEEFKFKYCPIQDGQVWEGDGFVIEAIKQPGHCVDHFSFLLNDQIWFSGDCLLGGSSTQVDDLGQYLKWMEHVLQSKPKIKAIYPGHGPCYFADCQAVIQKQIDHRMNREKQILAALDGSVDEILSRVYPELTDPLLVSAAGVNIKAHLKKLQDDGLVELRDDYKYCKI